MYDEPFSGLDPISLKTAARLIRQLNDSMGLTSLFVSHELAFTLETADHVIVLANGGVAAQGTPDDIRNSTDPMVFQYVMPAPTGRCIFTFRAHPGRRLSLARPGARKVWRGRLARLRHHGSHRRIHVAVPQLQAWGAGVQRRNNSSAKPLANGVDTVKVQVHLLEGFQPVRNALALRARLQRLIFGADGQAQGNVRYVRS